MLTFAGSITRKIGFPDTFTGTYAITGGCASGDGGIATGYAVPSLTGYWAGNLTTDGGRTVHWDTQLTQGGPTLEGSFDLTGTVDFYDCFATGTMLSGTFPEGSFIMGTAVNLKIKTDAATITFLGTADSDGLIRGNYTASGGACELTGTGYLSPWEY